MVRVLPSSCTEKSSFFMPGAATSTSKCSFVSLMFTAGIVVLVVEKLLVPPLKASLPNRSSKKPESEGNWSVVLLASDIITSFFIVNNFVTQLQKTTQQSLCQSHQHGFYVIFDSKKCQECPYCLKF